MEGFMANPVPGFEQQPEPRAKSSVFPQDTMSLATTTGQTPVTSKTSTGDVPSPPIRLTETDSSIARTDFFRKKMETWLGRKGETSDPTSKKIDDLQSTSTPGFGRRLSCKPILGLPRATTFQRQSSEQREMLTEVAISERRAATERRNRHRILPIKPVPDAATESGSGIFYEADAAVDIHDPIDNSDTLGDDASKREALDEEIKQELEKKWILNLSMHFRDHPPREKFFVTHAKTPTEWKRVTISCDYRNAPPDSLEQDPIVLQLQRDKSAAIYEAIRASLPDIQFYDTVTNLKLETREERLHVHVTEDVNEIGCFPTNGMIQDEKVPEILESQAQSRIKYSRIQEFKNKRDQRAQEVSSTKRRLDLLRKNLGLEDDFVAPTWKKSLIKRKHGLMGFVNGSDIAAMADTGSRENIISETYAKELGLQFKGSPSLFKIGNARKIQSLGTVSLLWAFAESPKETFSILCHVLPRCTYSLILGNGFLKATETMSRFNHRLTKCLFSIVNNVSQFGFLGETCQRLQGTIADSYPVLAIPDTGADRNVMSLQYALDHGLQLQTEPENRGYLQFADGSFDETVGQVKTYWTFASGERIPVTFEILRYCCSDVIIGEDVLTEHRVFQDHADSILSEIAFDNDSFELAPFDFINSWQRGWESLIQNVGLKKDQTSRHRPPTTTDARINEQRRRNAWNHKYDFGANATTGEKELEIARRGRYKLVHGSGGSEDALRDRDPSAPQQRMPVISSIPTSQSRR